MVARLSTIEDNQYVISFRITEFDCNPEDVTRLLQIEPTRTHKKGDQLRPSKNRVFSFNSWKFSIPLNKQSFSQDIIWFLEKIHPASEKLRKFPCQRDLNIGISYHGKDIPNLFLDKKCVEVISDIKTGFGFDFHMFYLVNEKELPRSEFGLEFFSLRHPQDWSIFLTRLETKEMADLYWVSQLPSTSSLYEHVDSFVSSHLPKKLPEGCQNVLRFQTTIYGGDNPLWVLKPHHTESLAKLGCGLSVNFDVVP